ncbi:MAG TPA: hypothetical protein VFK69_03560 [Candidatus Eisenbacteria bacterium]|nr:hypothetical protein [Candidatus Eisenbacteria bacterium]
MAMVAMLALTLALAAVGCGKKQASTTTESTTPTTMPDTSMHAESTMTDTSMHK